MTYISRPIRKVRLATAGVQIVPACGGTPNGDGLLADGNYNSYGSTKSCTEYNVDYDDIVLMAYQEYAAAAGWAPHPYRAC